VKAINNELYATNILNLKKFHTKTTSSITIDYRTFSFISFLFSIFCSCVMNVMENCQFLDMLRQNSAS